MNKELKIAFLSVMVAGLVGCASANKPPMPKGKWISVNPVGFIPPNATRYSDQTATINQPTEKSESGANK